MSTILLTGGTGFVGTVLRRTLADHTVRVLAHTAKPTGSGSNESFVSGSVEDPASLTAAAAGCDVVIHLVAIIEETGGKTFDGVIRQGTEHVVAAAKSAGVKRLISMSAMGAREDATYPYLNAKKQAENAVTQSGLDWTIFRPSVIFGPGDGFINVLANLVRKAPIIPVVGPGTSKFQPIAVQDVADAFTRAVNDPGTIGHAYDLGGGEIYSYEQMLDLLQDHLRLWKRKVHVPVSVMRPVVRLSAPLPNKLRPPVTLEQLRMLALDNITADSASEALIGRKPVALANGLDYITR